MSASELTPDRRKSDTDSLAELMRKPASTSAPAEPVPVTNDAPSTGKPSYEDVLEGYKKSTSNVKEKATVTLEPAVLNALRDVKKLYKIPVGVAIDLAVKQMYPDIYEKNAQELRERQER
ncbi:hypothetical protein [Glutamicibacter ardleyensis]|uniref:hypothetical protein n=1 Tax=Glutamicibacter ardleyensis TaxID=225894 RepID=UPI003FD14BFE